MNQVDYEINKELGECYLFMGEFDKARDYYTKALNCNGNMMDPYMGLAAIAVNKGELEDALALYTKANRLDSGEKPLTGMGMIAMELGKHADAYEYFRNVLSLNPGNMVAVNSILQLAYHLDRLEEVIPVLEAALTPGDTEAVRYALAACFLTIGRETEARQQLELLLGDNPSNDSAKQLYAHLAA
jgi:Cytochrome c biogenesis factor